MTIEEEVAAHKKTIAELQQAVAVRDAHIQSLMQSTSWRITRPMRAVSYFLQQVRQAVQLAGPAIQRGGGLLPTLRKALRLFRAEGFSGIKRGFRHIANTQPASAPAQIPEVFRAPLPAGCNDGLATRVLIIAEMSIPQCKKYRVQQKLDMLGLLGIQANALSWSDTEACLQALQTHTVVFFYRVPAFPNVLSIIQEARRLQLATFWEVDDLIFDKEVLANSKTLAALDRATYDGLLDGAVLYRTAMLACDRGIASTSGLALAMKNAGVPDVGVVENALDGQTLKVAQKVRDAGVQRATDCVRIVYGSGTNTHNIDFEEAVPALLATLERFTQVRLRIIGSLDLPDAFKRFEGQIERIPMCNYEEYMTFLAECHISIAPLENYVFNDSKSNIKYLEASILGVPSVCSPRAAFTQVIVHGENGFLCESTADWEAAFAALATDPALRERMGEAARTLVLQHYAPQSIANTQLAPLLSRPPVAAPRTKVLSVNCYYAPRSFGGATIVAEEVNQLLDARDDFEVHVFTAIPNVVTPDNTVKRYAGKGHPVYGLGQPDYLDETRRFDNPDVVKAFREVLEVVQPDVVHFHSIQGIGVAAADVCIEMGVPYVITLHDAWWLCGRQFMIHRSGKYCHQTMIDLKECATCVDNPALNQMRDQRLRATLQHAAALLSPSRFFADFYIANGWSGVKVNKNGVLRPRPSVRVRQNGPLRFGYVGGNTEIKGFHLVKKVFAGLNAVDAELILVDNAINLGFTSYHAADLQGLHKVKVVPAYTQATMDDFFGQIDVLLFPTQWKESFGLTIREALARNVWVITTDAGGVVEDIVPGGNGLIIPMADTGPALRQAVLDTVRHFEKIPPGETVTLPTETITYFEAQADELAGVFKAVTRTAKTAPAINAG